MKRNGFENILNFIENRINYIGFEDIFDVLKDSCMLQFDNVKNYCVRQLEQNITVENCLRIWQAAELLDIHPLAEKAKCKALMDYPDVRHTNDLLILSIKELHSYLSNTLLHCDNELDVFESGIKWLYNFCCKDNEGDGNEDEKIKYDTKYLLVILRCLDYTKITKSDVDNIFLVCPDLAKYEFITNILNSIKILVNEELISDKTLEDRTALEFYHNCQKRCLLYLPSIVCHEFNESYNKGKKSKILNCNCANTISIHYYGK